MYGQLKATVRTPQEAADSAIVLPTLYFTMIGPGIFLLAVIWVLHHDFAGKTQYSGFRQPHNSAAYVADLRKGITALRSYNCVVIYIRHAVIFNVVEQIADSVSKRSRNLTSLTLTLTCSHGI